MSLYRFNHLSGRVVGGAAQRVGQAITGSTTQDAPQIIFETKNVKFPKTIQTVKPPKPGFGYMSPALLRQYEHFQKDNGVPVHLKGGPVDVALYYLTIGGCVVGLIECFRYYYEAAFPKRE